MEESAFGSVPRALGDHVNTWYGLGKVPASSKFLLIGNTIEHIEPGNDRGLGTFLTRVADSSDLGAVFAMDSMIYVLILMMRDLCRRLCASHVFGTDDRTVA
jgi:hypothetical protein